MTKDSQLTEDIIQETFISLYLYDKSKFKCEKNLKYWLIKTATNKTLNNLKKTKKLLYVPFEFFEKESTHIFIPEKHLEKKETIKELKIAINSLPFNQKILIIMFYYLEIPQVEIAKILNVPLGSVKSRLNRAKIKIKKIIPKTSE